MREERSRSTGRLFGIQVECISDEATAIESRYRQLNSPRGSTYISPQSNPDTMPSNQPSTSNSPPTTNNLCRALNTHNDAFRSERPHAHMPYLQAPCIPHPRSYSAPMRPLGVDGSRTSGPATNHGVQNAIARWNTSRLRQSLSFTLGTTTTTHEEEELKKHNQRMASSPFRMQPLIFLGKVTQISLTCVRLCLS